MISYFYGRSFDEWLEIDHAMQEANLKTPADLRAALGSSSVGKRVAGARRAKRRSEFIEKVVLASVSCVIRPDEAAAYAAAAFDIANPPE